MQKHTDKNFNKRTVHIHSNRAQLKKNQQSSFYTATTYITSQIQSTTKIPLLKICKNKPEEISIYPKPAHYQHLHAHQDTNTWNQSTKSQASTSPKTMQPDTNSSYFVVPEQAVNTNRNETPHLNKQGRKNKRGNS